MNQDAIAAWCRDRIHAFNEADPMAWYPVYGWVRDDGARFGLALELIAGEPTKEQLRALGKALWRLGQEGELETARCRRRPGGKGLVFPPLEQGAAVTSRLAHTTSGGIRPSNSEYAVRRVR